MTRPTINGIAPCFIAKNVTASVSFYRDLLGFDLMFAEPTVDPFFAIVNREGAMIMLKDVGVEPVPNHTRHKWARWDAYVKVPDPDALAAEYSSRGVQFSKRLRDTHDGLRGFELMDADGYILFFGRPRS